MATSVVNFYKNDILTPGRNAMYAASETASGFSTWLSNSLKKTITDFQYIKHGLNISIKIDANQVIINKDIPDYPYNYVSITNSDDGRTFYYFIMDIEWVSQSTIRFILSIDSVATFWDDLDFNEKTTILREHKDRFYQKDIIDAGATLVRKIDEEPEGINPIQVKQSELTITDANIDDLSWYLIYKTEQDASKLDENPVKCYLCASEDLKIDQATGDTSITLGNLNKNYTYFFLDDAINGNGGFEVTTTSTNTFTLDEVSGGSTAKVLVIRYVNTEAKWFVGSLFYDNNDVYTNWLTQNGVNIGLNVVSSGLQVASGIGMMATGGGALAGAGNVASGILSIANTLGSIYQHSLIPVSVSGNVNCGDVNFTLGLTNLEFKRMSIKEEYARIIDNYFSMFGYKVNRVKVPNITGRSNWNYVKTIDCNFDGDIPQTDLNIIKEMFNNGVTLWHNPSTMYDYSQSNNII